MVKKKKKRNGTPVKVTDYSKYYWYILSTAIKVYTMHLK